MRLPGFVLLGFFLIVMSAMPLFAQSCTAISGKDADLLNVSLSAQRTRQAHSYQGRLGAAGKRAFGGLRIGAATFDTSYTNAYTFGVDFGGIVSVQALKNWVLCPTMDYAYQAGPNSNDPNEFITNDSYHSLSPGFAVGRPIELNSSVSWLPFVSGAFQKTRYERRFLGERSRSYLNSGIVRAGVGVQFFRNWVVRASVARPLGVASHDIAFLIGGTRSFASPKIKYDGK